jgi:hypothetical protein
MILITVLVGAAMLLFGRRLFWVFVAGVGFACGALVAAELLVGQEGWILLAAAIVGGVFGALIALFAQKLAVGVAGFLAGGYLGHALAQNLNLEPHAWIFFIVAGVLGALLLVALFDWTLIVLSSLTGALVIVEQVPWPAPWPAVVFLGLLVVGLAIQASQFRPRAKPTPPPAR